MSDRVREHNCTTGEVTERDPTPEEIAQHKKDAAAQARQEPPTDA